MAPFPKAKGVWLEGSHGRLGDFTRKSALHISLGAGAHWRRCDFNPQQSFNMEETMNEKAFGSPVYDGNFIIVPSRRQ